MTTAKYKVGQKVKVRDELVGGYSYGDLYFSESMEKFCGKEFTVEYVNDDDLDAIYTLGGKDEGEDIWAFTEEMLEPVEEKQSAQSALPRKVIELNRSAKLEIYVERVIVNDPAIIMFYRTALYDNYSGLFMQWSDTKKIVAKCNKDDGDEFNVEDGINVAILKAYRKEIAKQLRKY